MKEIDRETVVTIVRNRVNEMIEKERPGATSTDAYKVVLADLEKSEGFQALVTRQVAELEARMRGEVH